MIGGVSPHVPFGAENLWGWGAYGVLGLIYQAPVFLLFTIVSLVSLVSRML